MEAVDWVTLFGILVVFVTTLAGWFFTHSSQSDLQKQQAGAEDRLGQKLAHLESQLTFEREQTQFLIADKLAKITEIESWVEFGRRVYLEASSMSDWGPELDAQIDRKEIAKEEAKRRADELKALQEDSMQMRSQGPRSVYLAKLWDPRVEGALIWEWGSQEMPTDLPQLLSHFEQEVIDSVVEAIAGQAERANPWIDGQFEALHEATIGRLDTLKREAVHEQTT